MSLKGQDIAIKWNIRAQQIFKKNDHIQCPAIITEARVGSYKHVAT